VQGKLTKMESSLSLFLYIMKKTSLSKKGVFYDHSTKMDSYCSAGGLDLAGYPIHSRVLQTISKNNNRQQAPEMNYFAQAIMGLIFFANL
jgi:hypothetical protein